MSAESPYLLADDFADPHAQNYLRVIVDPGEQAQIDVVAVHGLNPGDTRSHALATWTKNEKLWLKDFLPREVPTARIMIFAYNANVAFESSTAGVLEQADNLLNRLRHKRRRAKLDNRPIIFVAHSLGGIMVKRALIKARQDDLYASIQRATYGLVFFGTPHRGGEHVPLGKLAARIVRAVYRNPNNSFLEALEKDSIFADSIAQDFCNVAESFKVVSFYENRPTGPLGLIVDKKSAVLGLGSNREIRIALDLDHRNICKFGSEYDDDYEMLRDNIVEMIEEAIESAPAREGLGISDASPPISPPTTAALCPDLMQTITYSSQPALLPPPARLDSYQDSIKSEPTAEVASLVDSVNQSTMSLALSDPDSSEIVNEKRRSASTVQTEYTVDLQQQRSGKRQVQSPSIFSSMHMNISDSDGSTLRTAAAEGQVGQVRLMLDQGAAIDNSGVWDGYTALAEAALHGQESVVQLLLERGANPAFHCISMTKKYGSKENTPLSLAAAKGHISTMKLLLGSHEYATSHLNGAFAAAKYRNRMDAMRLLKEYGGGMT
ncbi:hypothetical protein LTR27_005419 [Elasticomyces elasticus]|nr:hypothetical protein LTR27_005419 [Elasticomyces elasticus]